MDVILEVSVGGSPVELPIEDLGIDRRAWLHSFLLGGDIDSPLTR